MRWVAVSLGLALSALLVASIVNTLALRPRQPAPIPSHSVRFDAARLAESLTGALRLASVSADRNETTFDTLRGYLRQRYPALHAATQQLSLGQALMLDWPGSEAALPPLLFSFHLDVVPANAVDWTHPPFGGDSVDGHLWGRGAIDDKGGAIAFMEAAERLVADGFQPRRRILIVLGEDEEAGGHDGAHKVAGHLRNRGLRLEAVFDEGGFITEGVIPGVAEPVALIGIAEKGYLTVALRVTAQGGHSSLPPLQTAPGILAAGIVRVEGCRLAGGLRGPAESLLKTLAPHMPMLVRLAVANRWLSGPLLEHQLGSRPTTRALLYTTAATTVLRAGDTENVLARSAEALINLRLVPGDTPELAIQVLERCIDDPRVSVTVQSQTDAVAASPVASLDSKAYRTLAGTIVDAYPEVLVSPWITVGATDSRHYAGLTDSTLRFRPIRLGRADVARIHGVDERLPVDDLVQAAGFYHRLLRNLDTTLNP